MTYGFTIHYDIDLEFTILLENNEGNKEKINLQLMKLTLEKKFLGRFPIMLMSNLHFK